MNPILPWHGPVLERLWGLSQSSALPHAIALTCPPGWGHQQLLAAASLRLLGLYTDQPVEEIAYADFRWLAPEGRVIKIDAIRRLNQFAQQTPQMGGCKVAAIVDAHLLNTNAANALLKTLEEPSPATHVLLATPFWGKLMPTIRSRCQRFQVAADRAGAQAWLVQQGCEVDDLSWAAAGHAPLTLLESRHHAGQGLDAWLMGLSHENLDAAVSEVLERDVATWLANWYRRILLHAKGHTLNDSQAPLQSLLRFADGLLLTRQQIESSNAANARLLLEDLVVRWLAMNAPQRG